MKSNLTRMHNLPCPNALLDVYANAAEQAAFQKVLHDKATADIAFRIASKRAELVQLCGAWQELRNAVSDQTQAEVEPRDLLLAREAEVDALVNQARANKKKWAVFLNELAKKNEPYVLMAAQQSLDLPPKAKTLEAEIKGYEANRKACFEKYQAAGLSDQDIEQIGLRPNQDDLSGWQGELKRITSRLAQIAAFQRTRPFYDVTLLDSEEN
ncbi:hypothetical protein K6V90_25000 [Cupriavidus pauculus]|uniref:hypothetical protein n=1 Tax=Cupriavidus pauculus TaxID=82633 RepID=UPI001C935151|nr:hypothetical protein [Cupriavidus pauculus]MBY4733801.1 hypothetical protein [Cupriavidus pauculus]